MLASCGGKTAAKFMGDARFPTFLDADLARIEIGERFTRPPDDDVIPKSGNAKYAGIMIVGLREEDGRAAGAVTLDVSFLGDGNVSGSATDFVRRMTNSLKEH